MTPGGWPDAARPGVPMHPERDGWHWLLQIANGKIRPWQWYAAREGDPGAYGDFVGSELLTAQAASAWRYIGPCLLPAEVAARDAAARREVIEEAAKAAMHFAIHQTGDTYDVYNAIRALLKEPGRD